LKKGRLPAQLVPLIEDGAIEEVIQPLMSGKEASLWVVKADGRYFAAKVYKEAQNRTFHNRADYMEGRAQRDTRQGRALQRKSRYGRELAESSWQNAEVDALHRLDEAGVRVPKPLVFVDNVLVMDLILDADGKPAPRLVDIEFQPQEARNLLDVLLDQAVRMLLSGVVHGDLSEYNVLMAYDGPVIIDLPQATSASHNRNARRLFLRDIGNIVRFVGRFAPELLRRHFGEEIWALYEKGLLTPGIRLSGHWQPEEHKVDAREVLREMESLREFDMRKPAPPHRPGASRDGSPPSLHRRVVDFEQPQSRKPGGEPPRGTSARGHPNRPQSNRPGPGRPRPRPPSQGGGRGR
jgi:RIO kinase 1